MSVVYLFYTESDAFGGSLSAAFAVPMLDQFVLMRGGILAGVHPVDADYPPHVPLTYPTLEDAQSTYPNHKWVYMDASGPKYLDEFNHPADDVVYVAGHDRFGYGASKLSGTKLKLRLARSGLVGHAIPTLILVTCDRWTRML